MRVTKNTLYVYRLPENHKYRFVVGVKDQKDIVDEGGQIVAGPFGTFFGEDPITDNGWEAANKWISLHDDVAWNYVWKGKLIWDQIETVVEGVSFFDDMGTSWYRWLVIKWPKKLPNYYVVNPNENFTEMILSKFSMERSYSGPGQAFTDYGSIMIDRDLQYILLTQRGGLDI